MYTPDRYKNKNPEEIFQFVKENGFGTLITQLDGIPYATSIPMVIEKDEAGKIMLRGHVSKENPQAETFIDGTHALAVFHGPHAYISSSWYNHENVSTWNYLAAQASGKLYLLNELELIESLIHLTQQHEAGEANPKYFENIDPRVIRNSLTGITGFSIQVDSMQASYKLSQNRGDEDRQQIISQLQKRGDESSKRIAEEMKKNVSK
jgi:transcriptional regulator